MRSTQVAAKRHKNTAHGASREIRVKNHRAPKGRKNSCVRRLGSPFGRLTAGSRSAGNALPALLAFAWIFNPDRTSLFLVRLLSRFRILEFPRTVFPSSFDVVTLGQRRHQCSILT